MDQQEAFSEAVFIFEGDGVAAEMLYADFESALSGEAKLESFAASRVAGMYVVIGAGLSIRGVVCFLINVDEDGLLDRSFSIPLRHLANVAGPGPDLGSGPIRLACRSQCPVSWHAHNLWEPEGQGDAHPLVQAQATVRTNRLGYDEPSAQTTTSELDFDVLGDVLDDSLDDLIEGPLLSESAAELAPDEPAPSEAPPQSASLELLPPDAEPAPQAEEPAIATPPPAEPATAKSATPKPPAPKTAPKPAALKAAPKPAAPKPAAPKPAPKPAAPKPALEPVVPKPAVSPSESPSSQSPAGPAGLANGNGRLSNGMPGSGFDDDPYRRQSREMLQRRIERAIGEEGTVNVQKLIIEHSEQIDKLTAKYRQDLEQQQQSYLNQIRDCRDEIQKLKSELRHEQNRNMRLQQLLRGER